jgi:hypothetical protein
MIDDMEGEEIRLRDRDQSRDTIEWNGASSSTSPTSDYRRSNMYRENWSHILDKDYNYARHVAAAATIETSENIDAIPYNDHTEPSHHTIEWRSKSDYPIMEASLVEASNLNTTKDDKTNITMTTASLENRSASTSSAMYKINYGSGLELYERLGQVGEGTYG